MQQESYNVRCIVFSPSTTNDVSSSLRTDDSLHYERCQAARRSPSHGLDRDLGGIKKRTLRPIPPLIPVPSLPQRGTVSPETPGWRPLSVTLHHSEAVTLATIPKRQGANAGLIPVTIPEDGRYRISAGSAVWIEVVQGRMRIEPIRFEMQTGCAALFKTVEYQLKQGADYWIELSGNTSTVTLLLSPTTR